MYLTAKTHNDFITNLQTDFPQSQEEVRFVKTTKTPITISRWCFVSTLVQKKKENKDK